MSTKKKSDYVARPDIDVQVHPETLRRLEVISRVMSGQTTVSDAARELGLSRNRFQTIYHRALSAMMVQLEPGTPGRPPHDPVKTHLVEENQRLEAELRSVTVQLEASRRATMGLAEIVREQHSIGKKVARQKRTAAK